MKTILVSTIIDKVKEKLSVYFENDSIDDAILYNKFDNLKSNFRLNDYILTSDVLVVENSQATLPEDFYKACLILGCYEYTVDEGYTGTWTVDEEKIDICEYSCNVNACRDECGNLINLVQKFNRYAPRVYQKFDLLSLGQNMTNFCSDICINNSSKSGNTITINHGKITTEFEEGLIYVEYFKDLDIGTDYEIPYHPKVVQWLESEFILEIFETLYYNGLENIVQRYQNAKVNANRDYWSAKSILKTPEFTELYGISNALIERYNRIRYNIWDDTIHSKSYYLYNSEVANSPNSTIAPINKSWNG